MNDKDDASLPEKVDISEMFRSAKIVNRSKKLTRVCNALKWKQTYQNSESYSLQFDDLSSMTIKQILNGEMKGFGTGTLVWPAAHVLIKYLEKRFGCNGFHGKRVCDVGSGTGITGLAAAVWGGLVLLTDQAQLLPILLDNVNGVLSQNLITSGCVSIAKYDWGYNSTDVILANQNFDFDYIFVSDCVLPKLYPIEILIQGVEAIMGINTVAFFSYEHRPFPDYDPRQEFERLAFEFGLHVQVIPLSEHNELFCAEDIEIWEVCRIKHHKLNSVSPSLHNNSLVIWNWGSVSQINVTLKGVHTVFEQNPCGVVGSFLWPASVILSRYLLSTSLSELKSLMSVPSTVGADDGELPFAVELGAGCGLASVALSCGGYSVLATDKSSVVDLLQTNVDVWQERTSDLNGCVSMPHIAVQELDWSTTCAAQPINTNGRIPDLIVCSDCVYSSSSVSPLLNMLEKLSGPDTVIAIANEVRTAFDEFVHLADRSENFNAFFVELSLTEPDLELFRNRFGLVVSPPLRMCLLRLKPKSNTVVS